jgi:glycosyltransferase involved in cell wall biosynthesis
MKISIITPAYNPGSLILETFDSLECQSFKNFEWIIVDDCSNLENKHLFNKIKNIASFTVRIISNPTNFKQAKSKNIGLEHSNGEYIKFLDADDLIDPCHLQNQLLSIENFDNFRFAIFSPTVHFWKKNKRRKEVINTSYKTVPVESFEQLKRFIVSPFFHHCSCLFRKHDIIDINGFDENLITDEDGDFILRLMFNGVLFICQDNSNYFYRQHNNKRVSNNDSIEKWEHRYRVCEKIESQLSFGFSSLKEQLAQRLDLLSIQAYEQNNTIYIRFLSKAKSIYPNYKFVGNKLQNFLRKIFGFKFTLMLKSFLK